MDVTLSGNVQAAPPPPPTPAAPAAGTSGYAPSVAAEVVAVPQTAPAPAPAPAPGEGGRPAERTAEPDVLPRAVREINTSIQAYGRHLDVRFHEATGRRVVTVYDSVTNEAVREIPPERVLDAHANILELAGLFVDSRG